VLLEFMLPDLHRTIAAAAAAAGRWRTEQPNSRRPVVARSFLARWLAGGSTPLLDAIPRTVSSVPEELGRLVRQMLVPDVNARPADAALVHQALRDISERAARAH
jgi:hypothetical protein